MQYVKDILTEDNSFFAAMKINYADLYNELFDATTSSDELDIQLLVNCGERYASPLLVHYQISKVVDYVVKKYGDNWKRCKDALTAEYDVLKPYDLVQVTTGEKAATNDTASNSENKTGVVGFDSELPTDNTVDTNNNSVNIAQNETNNATVSTSGNTGNQTNTALIMNELEMRKTSFISLVINDIQTQLTLDIY